MHVHEVPRASHARDASAERRRMQDYIESLGGHSRSLPKSFTKCLSLLKSPHASRHGFSPARATERRAGSGSPAMVRAQRGYFDEPPPREDAEREQREEERCPEEPTTLGRSRGRQLYARLMGRAKSRDRCATLPPGVGQRHSSETQAGQRPGVSADPAVCPPPPEMFSGRYGVRHHLMATS